MPDFRDQYKEKPFGFRGANESRLLRAEKCEKTRKSQRTNVFNQNRNIPYSANTTPQHHAISKEEPVAKEDRMTRFKKWKAERERKKRVDQTAKKRPFVVGVVHHKIYSPAANKDESFADTSSKHKPNVSKTTTSKKISKVTEMRLKAKAMKQNVKPRTKVTNPPKRKAQRTEQSIAPADYKFTAPSSLMQMPLFGKTVVTTIDKHIKNFTLSTPKRKSLAKRASTSVFLVENIQKNESIGPTNAEVLSEENHPGEEDSVETIALRLSSDSCDNLNSSPETRIPRSYHNSLRSNTSNNKSGRSLSSDSASSRSLEEVQLKSPVVSLHKLSNKALDSSLHEMDVLLNSSKSTGSFSSDSKSNTSPDEIKNRSYVVSPQKSKIDVLDSTARSKDVPLNQSRVSATLNTTFEYEKSNDASGSNKSKMILNSSTNERTPEGVSRHTPSEGTSSDSKKLNSSSDPALFSPYIVSSRGKSNARKEQQIKQGLGRSPVDGIPTKDTVMQSLNISIEDEERTAQYFRFLLRKEVERLGELCSKWEEIKTESGVTEDAHYLINQAIGQTNLLLNKKFERFRALISDCETGKGEMLVTCKDLQGFWEMMYREVNDCEARFQKLEKSRAENWAEEKPEIVKQVVKKKPVAKKKVAPVPRKPSSIRALIMAARKGNKLQGAQSSTENSDTSPNDDCLSSSSTNTNKTASPAVQFYSRRSIAASGTESKKTPGKRESTRMSLLQKVQLSETSKKIRSPLTVMKISKMCKTPDPKFEESRSFPNHDQTPGKSILKKSKDTKDADTSMKLTHKVNFDDNVILNEVPVDEEESTKLDLAAALTRIENFDFDTSREFVELAVERKLDFDSDSSNESDDILDKIEKQEELMEKERSFHKLDESKVPLFILQEATPLKEVQGRSTPKKKSPRRQAKEISVSPLKSKESSNRRRSSMPLQQLLRQNAIEDSDEDEHNQSIRVLRNRTINAQEVSRTPKSPRIKASTSMLNSVHKENTTPSRRRRKSSLKVTSKDEPHSRTDLEDAMDLISLNETDTGKSKRTTRLSVKYSESDCTGCIESKPVFPVTPHIRRSKLQSGEKKRRSSYVVKSASLDTPEKLPERIRRSSRKL